MGKRNVFKVIQGEKYVMSLSVMDEESEGVGPAVESPCDGIYVSAGNGFIFSDSELEKMGFVDTTRLNKKKGNGKEDQP